MSFNKFPWTNLHGFNLDWVIETVQNLKTQVEEFVSQDFETKTFVTNNRKLSETGNFTGSWFGKSLNYILGLISNNAAKIDSNSDQIAFISDQFSDGATGLVIDCGFFNETIIDKQYDGGVW